ncbi:unnamed protein product [Gongylonema pulchrum]|uniref:B2-adapt-app_C domain-containing protein n=1 Tax=Gongylonema pulchrum TaxID=637853 RepID=A0A183DFY8_9BILA|nr:unnamed protein product [Gongylonema pulchrum]
MEPLTNLQVAIKNDIGVFYFATVVPLSVYFDESGQMDKHDICTKLQQNNVFTVARRNVEGQELLYHSIKYTNQIYVLSELKMQDALQPLTVSNLFHYRK